MNDESQMMLNSLKCSIANDGHFVDGPVSMSCGHIICKNCRISNLGYEEIVCAVCGTQNKLDLTFVNEITTIKQLFSANLEQLFEVLKQRYKSSVDTMKKDISLARETIDVQIQYAKEEIEIQIESMKLSLEELSQELISNLNSHKEDFLNHIEDLGEENYETSMEILEESVGTVEDFYFYQNELRKLNKNLKSLENFIPKIVFSQNTNFLKKDLIGHIDCNFSFKSLLDKSNPKSYIISDLPDSTYDACTLPGDKILVISKQYNLSVLDSNFKKIENIEKMNNEIIEPCYVTTNNVDKIYISEFHLNKLIVANMKFKLISKFGRKGSGNQELWGPRGLFFYKNSLYVCDGHNKRIQKFSDYLVYESTYSLSFKPWRITIIHDLACITPREGTLTYFYDLANFQLKHKYDLNGTIFSLNSNFYQFCADKKTFHIYDMHGELSEKVKIEVEAGVVQFDEYESIFCLNKKLALTAADKCFVFQASTQQQ